MSLLKDTYIKDYLKEIKGGKDYRLYIDPRRKEYPSLTDAVFGLNETKFNMTGSHYLHCYDYSTNLQLYFDLNEGSGTNADDQSTNNNDGTISGASWETLGLVGQCLDFDGTDDKITVSDNNSIDLTGDHTISLWIKTDSTDSDIPLMDKRNTGTSEGWYLYLKNGAVSFIYGDTSWHTFGTGSPDLRDNNWHNIVLTTDFTGNESKIYIDGELKKTIGIGVAACTATAEDLLIGEDKTTTYYFDGLMDEIRIYSEVWNAQQVKWIYENPQGVIVENKPDYLLDMQSTFTVRIRFKPGFTYDTSADKILFSWYNDADSFFKIYYSAANDKFTVEWQDGGTARTLESAAYTTNLDLQQITTIDATIDLTTGLTTGSALYINRSSVDTSWSGNIDAKGENYHLLSIGHQDGGDNNAESNIGYVMLFPEKIATATEVANNFKDIKDEAIVWFFNGVSLGRTRCDVRDKTLEISLEMTKETESGAMIANHGVARLYNGDMVDEGGWFSDDQYSVFDASNEDYNGVLAKSYLRTGVGINIDVYSNNTDTRVTTGGDTRTTTGGDTRITAIGEQHEQLFVGRVNTNGFKRETVDNLSHVTIEFDDIVQDIKNDMSNRAIAYENFLLCSREESVSLLHTLVRLLTEKATRNYASNTSFENATIANTWVVFGTGATLTKAAGGIFGSNEGQMASGVGGNAGFYTYVKFDTTKLINKDEIYNLSIYIKSASVSTGTLKILEYVDAVDNSSETSESWSLSGGDGWQKVEVSHTITETDTNRLRLEFNLTTGSVSVSCDGVMLIEDQESIDFFIENTNDGAAGVSSADDYIDGTYDTVGFDVKDVSIVHPWALVKPQISIWAMVQELGDATASRFLGIDPSGTLRFRAVLENYWSDPTSIGTLSSEVMENNSELGTILSNWVVIKGDYIKKVNRKQMLWNARATNDFTEDNGGQLRQLVANSGGTFPDVDTFGEYVCKYGVYEEPQRQMMAMATGDEQAYYRSSRRRTTPSAVYGQPDNTTIIGATDIELRYKTEDGSSLTETKVDTSTYADGVVLKLTNSTGSAIYVTGCSFLGKRVYKYSYREGYIHDSFLDKESIRRYGLQMFKLDGNSMIIDSTQVNKLADWHWKLRKKQRHIYQSFVPGAYLWYTPGEWYDLSVGSTGKGEGVSSTCIVQKIIWTITQDQIETTEIIGREVYQNWSFNINYGTRFQSLGFLRRIDESGPFLIVGDSEYTENAHVYCDGTADEVEIQACIDALSSTYGGGTVHLTRGTFNVTANSIVMKAGVTLEGEGQDATIIEKNLDDYAIEIAGSNGSEIEKVTLKNLKVTKNASDTNAKPLIYWTYADDCVIDSCFIDDSHDHGIYLDNNDRTTILNCKITNCDTSAKKGIYLFDCNYMTVTNNIVEDNYDGIDCSTQAAFNVRGNNINMNKVISNDNLGIYVEENIASNINNNMVYQNTLHGIKVEDCGKGLIISSNSVENNTGDGILIDSCTAISVNGNLVYNNQDDGIEVTDASLEIAIAGNTVKENSDDGILIDADSDNCILTGNTIEGNGGDGIIINNANCDRTVVTGNRSTGNTGNNFTDSGTNTTNSGNDFN